MSVSEISIRVAGSPGGRVIGLIDQDRKVHKQTPSFTRELLGSVDADGIVRLEDGQAIGEPIAMIAGTRVVTPSLDPTTAPVLGFINDIGEIRPSGSDRVLGVVDDADPVGMAFFALAYRKLVAEIDELEAEVRAAKNKYQFRDRIQKRAETLTDSDVLGDVTALIARLARLDNDIESEVGEKVAAKERLAAEAEALSESSNWKATGDRLKAAFEEWKRIGSAGKEPDERLWAQFSSAREKFNKRRSADFELRQATRGAARARKEAIIVEAAALIGVPAPVRTTVAVEVVSTESSLAPESVGVVLDVESIVADPIADGSEPIKTDETIEDANAVAAEGAAAAHELAESVLTAEVIESEADVEPAVSAPESDIVEIAGTEALPNGVLPGGADSLDERRESIDSAVPTEQGESGPHNEEATVAAPPVSVRPNDFRSLGDKLRDLQNKWKEAGSAGRTDDDELWARLQSVTKPFYEQRSSFYTANQVAKEALVAKAEALSTSDNRNATANALKALQAEWKTIPSAGRDADEALWTKFRAANQVFFGRRAEVVVKREPDLLGNLAAKGELVKRALQLRWAPDAFASANEARELQAKWKEIGPVPREKSDELWKMFREACDKIFANVQSARNRRESDFNDRLKDAMDRKLEQLGEILRSIDRDQEQLDRLTAQLTAKPSADLEKRCKEISVRIKEKQKRADQVESSLFEIRDKVHGAVE